MKNEWVLIIFLLLATGFSTNLWKSAWHNPAHDPKNIAQTGFVKYKEAVQLATPPATKQLITSLAIRLPLIKMQIADPVITEEHIAYQIERGAKTNAWLKISVSRISGSVTIAGKNVKMNIAPKKENETEM